MRTTFRVVLPGGTTRRVVANGILTTDDCASMRIVGWFERPASRHHVQRSVRTSAQRMALAAAAADVGFWRADLVTQTRWGSPFAMRIFGLEPHETMTNEALYAAVHPEDRERVRIARTRAIAERGRFDAAFRVVGHDGVTRWVHSIAVVVRDPRTGHDQLIGVVADVTTRFLAQQELLEQQRQLTHLARVAVLGELSGAITHELSQPITSIVTNTEAAQLMLETAGDIDRAAFHEILNDIADAGKRAGAVMHRIRGLIKNEPLATEVVHFGELVTETLAIMRSELLAHDVTTQVDISASLPDVRGDRVQLQQILVNLILNACEAMAEEPVDRRVLITAVPHEENGCELVISDRGPGIALTPPERIFEPFVTSKAHGVGLGLAICRKVVMAHGGRLWAENNPARGASFHLVLPSAVGVSPSLRLAAPESEPAAATP
jgi:PAS domain S-box-containing protein